jgi:hypothetical protein
MNWIHICGAGIENKLLKHLIFRSPTEHCGPCGYRYVLNLGKYAHKYDFHQGYPYQL